MLSIGAIKRRGTSQEGALPPFKRPAGLLKSKVAGEAGLSQEGTFNLMLDRSHQYSHSRRARKAARAAPGRRSAR